MNKYFYILILSFVFMSLSAKADSVALDNSNWGVQPASQKSISKNQTSQAQDEWQDTFNNYVYDMYGCETSPGFLNRSNMNNFDTYDGGSYTDEYSN